MKLLTFYHGERESVGILQNGLVFPLTEAETGCRDMLTLIENYDDAMRARISKLLADGRAGLPLEQIAFCAPIPRPRHDVICLGMNYLGHAKETARFKGVPFEQATHAVYFSKRVKRALGVGEPIPSHAGLTRQLDYEAELAVIIGKECRAVAQEQAFEYIFGYTIANDVSSRDLQLRHGGQFYFSKSLDGFLPLGPYIATLDEIADPARLRIQGRVNGETRQDSVTGDLIFNIPHIISELSQGMTLEAGDIIITGTPAGVGMGFDPPRYLQSGDTVECEIEGLGVLRNWVE